MSWSPLHRGSSAGSEPAVRAGLTGAKVLPFKRRAVKTPRRKRSLTQALVKPFVTALLVVGCPAMAGAWLLTSPRLAVIEIRVQGTHNVSEAWVTERLQPFVGRSLLTLDLATASRLLGEHPWAESFEITKELPDRLLVTVRERRPAVVLDWAGRSYFADASGRLIAPAAAGKESDARTRNLLRVSSSGDRAEAVPLALAVARELARIRPDWAESPFEIEVISKDDVRLHVAALPFPLRLRPGDVEPKIRRLGELLPWLLARPEAPGAVDLRVGRRIIVEPAGKPAKTR